MPAYSEKKWGKTIEGEYVTDGYVFRGKIRFKKAIDGLKNILVKGVQKEYRGLKFKALDRREKGTGIEAEVEIETNKKHAERGNAFVQLLGPNNKKEHVVMVLKSKGSEAKFVVYLAEEIIKPMMENFIEDKNVGDIEEAESSENEDFEKTLEKYKCEVCDKIFKSNKGLKSHITRTHKAQESKPEIISIKDNKTEKKYEEKCEMCDHSESASRKYLALQKILNHKETTHKSIRSIRFMNCTRCDYECKDNMTMKRHVRDVNEAGTFSTSPPPKKKRKVPTEKSIEEKMEVDKDNDDIKDLSFKLEDMEIDENSEELLNRSKIMDNKIQLKSEHLERQETEMKEKLLKKQKEKHNEKEVKEQIQKQENKKRKQKSKDERKRKNQKNRKLNETLTLSRGGS